LTSSLEALDVILIEDGRHRLMFCRKILDRLEVLVLSSTPAFTAAVYASSGNRSHAVKTRSCRVRERHELLDLRHALLGALAEPNRAIWLSDPIGNARPRRTFSTPAMTS